ncbi:competence protein CoiA [Flavobacterium psychrotrophum]|uniref:competence protein CoiA n=1 Tax=Flavobacterium psychrotrophum TaxID=2294119 RepID=UPI000E30D3AE|nr:CoiA-like domain protein [Flavobacterium psychrotrophum]
MKFSLVNGIRTTAFKGGAGVCECCGAPTKAKCGSRIVHHWSHVSLIECDSWWENETLWHRNWKNQFPNDWQEVTHTDLQSGEIHRADVKTSYGLVIELQNSPISYEEQTSREQFYKNMIWIINGEKFKNTFHILDKLPNPDDEFTKDIRFNTRRKQSLGKSFFRYSLNPDLGNPKYEGQLFLVSNMETIQKQIDESYIGHHLYDWVKPRRNWEGSNSKVFIDFGDDKLYLLMRYGDYKMKAVRTYDKAQIISRLLNSNKYK